MISLTTLIILFVGAMRLERLVRIDHGPFNLIGKMRYAIGVRHDEESRVYGTTTLSEMITCPYCNSVWIGIITAIMMALLPEVVVVYLFLPFCISGFITFLADHALIPT